MSNLTQIREILRGCVFNPKVNGPLKIIAESGNSEFLQSRAKELITECQNNFNPEKIKFAISLLALSLAQNANTENIS